MQVNLVLIIGSTTLVPTHMRGKLGGLFNTGESLGRFLGPAGYAVTYAWSISPPIREAYGGWVDYRFVFYASAGVLVVVVVTAWSTITLDTLINKPGSENHLRVRGVDKKRFVVDGEV